MLITKLLIPIALAFLLAAPAPTRTQGPGCVGCIGVGGSASASGGSCGGTVSISVQVSNGECKWVYFAGDPPYPECLQKKPCVPTVTRTWSGLGPNTPMDFCVTLAGQTLCLEPPPSSGPSGSGSDTRQSADMACSDDPADTRSYSVGSPSCGLNVSTEARCSACTGL